MSRLPSPILTAPGEIGVGAEDVGLTRGAQALFGALNGIVLQNVNFEAQRARAHTIAQASININELIDQIDADTESNTADLSNRFSAGIKQIVGSINDPIAQDAVSVKAADVSRRFRRQIRNKGIQFGIQTGQAFNNTITHETDMAAHKEQIMALSLPRLDENRLLLDADIKSSNANISEFQRLAGLAVNASDLENILQRARQENESRAPALRLSPQKLESSILGPAMEDAANLGLTDRLRGIIDLADNISNVERNELINLSERKEEGNRLEAERLIERQARLSAFEDVNSNDWRRILNDSVDSGVMTPRRRDQLTSELSSRQRGISNRTHIEQQKERVYQSVMKMSLDESTGGLQAIQDITVQDLDGNPVAVSADSIRKVVTNRFVNQTLADESMSLPDRRSQVMNFLQRNDTTYEPWKNRLSSLSGLPVETFTSEGGLPESVENDFDLLRQMDTEQPRLVREMVGDDDFINTFLLRDKMDPDNSQKSAFEASVATLPENRTRFANNVNPREVTRQAEDITSRFFRSDAKNLSTVSDVLDRLATFHLKRTRTNSEAALEAAVSEFNRSFQLVNGYYVNTASRRLPPNIEVATEQWIKEYVKEHGIAEGLTEGDLSVVPNSDGSMWQIMRMDTEIPTMVDNVPDGVASASALHVFVNNAMRDASERIAAESQAPGVRIRGVRKGRQATRKISDIVLDGLSVVATGVVPERSEEETMRQRELAKQGIANAASNVMHVPSTLINAIRNLDREDIKESIRRLTDPVDRGRESIRGLLGRESNGG